jgi:large subunit ribosomal protein L19
MTKNFNLKINTKDKISNYYNIIQFVEKKALSNNILNGIDINVGDIIRMEYNISLEKNKIRTEIYEGLIISKQNKNYNKSIILRRNIKGIIIEQIFPLVSPRILSIIIKKTSKIRKSRLFFVRKLSEKKIRTKLKFY